jgi:hypothetical protein
VRWTYWRETEQVRSSTVLAGGDSRVAERVERIAAAMAAGEAVDRRRVEASYQARAAVLGITPVAEPALTAEEQVAARLVPVLKPSAPRAMGPGPGGPGGGQAGAPPSLSGYYATEARAMADGVRSILDIRGSISAEFGPIDVERVVAFFRAAEATGTATITEKPITATKGKKTSR